MLRFCNSNTTFLIPDFPVNGWRITEQGGNMSSLLKQEPPCYYRWSQLERPPFKKPSPSL